METAACEVRRVFRKAMDTPPVAPLLADCPRVIAAYSGGADSAALLVLLAEYCAERGILLTAIHVHHGIRGAEADRDAAACADFCRTRGIECRTVYVDAPAHAASAGIGLEEAARILRYGALTAAAEEIPGTRIATAHSADDNLETVLFRLVRGTALSGLCGIPPVRDGIFRPLLGCGADAIRAFCRAEEIPFVTDSTNGDTAYTRNYIRAEIVPRLGQIAPDPALAVTRMCSALRADAACLDGDAIASLGSDAAGTSVPLAVLAELPDALLSRAVLHLYENAARTRRDLAAVHLQDVMRLVRRGGYGRICLPGEIAAVISAGRLSFLPDAEPLSPPENFSAVLSEGENFFPEFGFGICLSSSESKENAQQTEEYKNIYKLSIRTSLSFATIKGTVRLRFRQPGDTVRIGGMTRSVKKLLNAAKIPPESRALLPFLTDDAGILWIPGLPVRDSDAEGGGYLSITYFHL